MSEVGSKAIDVAPEAELARYLRVLYHALIVIRNYGFSRRKEEALFCGILADALHNVPSLLLRYGEFDQEQFRREVDNLRGQVPPRLAPAWDTVFRELQETDGQGFP